MAYNTKQKELIIKTLKDNRDKGLSTDELMKKTDVSRATLYRYLDKAVELGTVRKFYNDTLSRYEFQYVLYHDCEHHLHLKCLNCGSFIHLECMEANNLVNHIFDAHNFKIDLRETVIYGLCDKCQKEVL